MKELLSLCIEASVEAGKEIMDVYGAEFEVENKSDDSPLTEADKRAHLKIMSYLTRTDIPVLSEEGAAISYDERKDWSKLWIVDPLDGTKEFVKRNGEFTVNIALVENGVPILGVIYVPVKKVIYYAAQDLGAFKNNVDESDLSNVMPTATKLPMSEQSDVHRVVGSRSHMSPETEEFVNELRKTHDKVEMVSMGSSLKICLVAEGSAEVYPRFAPTMEWDTAAGHAIAKYAGKTVLNWKTKAEVNYNRSNLRNDWFIVQ